MMNRQLISFKNPYLWAVLSAVGCGTSFYVPHAWPLVFVSLVPLLHALRTSVSKKTAYALGCIVGLGILGTATFAFISARILPSTLGISSQEGVVALAVSWLLILIVTVPVLGLWSLALSYVPLRHPLTVVAASVLWVILEFLRMYTFNVMTYAPGITNPPFFSAGFLGYALAANISYVQLAALGGVAALSAFAVFVNMVLYRSLTSVSLTRAAVTTGGILFVLTVIALVPLASWREHFTEVPTTVVRVGIMSLSLPQATPEESELQAWHAQSIAAISKLSAEQPNIILLPEGEHAYATNSMRVGGVPDTASVVVGSAPAFSPDTKIRLEAFEENLAGTIRVPLRTKIILMPQGEYLIGLFRSALTLAGRADLVRLFAGRYTLASGNKGAALQAGPVHASVVFCLEIFSPDFARTLVQEQGSNLLLATVSHARFRPSALLDTDTLRMLRVQAVASGVPVALSSKGAPAFVLDRYGRVISYLSLHEGSLSSTVVSVVVSPVTAPLTQ